MFYNCLMWAIDTLSTIELQNSVRLSLLFSNIVVDLVYVPPAP